MPGLCASNTQHGGREVRVPTAPLDPPTRGRARLLGFHVVEPPPDHPALANDPALGSSTLDGDVEQPTAPLPVGGGGPGAATDDNLSGWVLTSSVPTFPPASTTTSPW